jgi:hypothetical protein
MRHCITSRSQAADADHYAVAPSAQGTHVLAQLHSGADGTQVRIILTPAEARHLAELLTRASDVVDLGDDAADEDHPSRFG